jgi:hypothetical protein
MSLWNLTDKAQKELSLIQAKLRSQRSIIEKEKGVIEQKGDTYVYNRASNALASYKAKIEKAEADYKAAVAKYEAEIEKNEKIMYDEKHKSTPVIIRAEIEIANLEKQKEQLLLTNNIQTEPIQVPLTQAPEGPSLMQQEEELANLRKSFGPSTTSWAQPLPKTTTIYGAVSQLEKRPVKCVKKV